MPNAVACQRVGDGRDVDESADRTLYQSDDARRASIRDETRAQRGDAPPIHLRVHRIEPGQRRLWVVHNGIGRLVAPRCCPRIPLVRWAARVDGHREVRDPQRVFKQVLDQSGRRHQDIPIQVNRLLERCHEQCDELPQPHTNRLRLLPRTGPARASCLLRSLRLAGVTSSSRNTSHEPASPSLSHSLSKVAASVIKANGTRADTTASCSTFLYGSLDGAALFTWATWTYWILSAAPKARHACVASGTPEEVRVMPGCHRREGHAPACAWAKTRSSLAPIFVVGKQADRNGQSIARRDTGKRSANGCGAVRVSPRIPRPPMRCTGCRVGG
eukprot:156743-Prymnesium_polylepis.1